MSVNRRTLLLSVAAASVCHRANARPSERWPDIKIDPEWVRELNERFAGRSGIYHDGEYALYLQDYTSDGAWLNWGRYKNFVNDDEIVMHDSGMPQVTDGKIVYWNAVTLAHHALIKHGRFVLGMDATPEAFYAAANKLIELQAPNGGFPYPAREHRHNKLPDGWISAMAQGCALSVFYRAFSMSREPRYLDAGRNAFSSLMTPVEHGGARSSLADLDPSLSGYVFFPEYPNRPVDYTLNGFMFALVGIYDWSKVAPSAGFVFSQGVRTLERLLPYHDIDSFSTYDLAHVVLPNELPYVVAHYEGIHVYLLRALSSVTGSEYLKSYEQRWNEKLVEMNKALRITSIFAPIAAKVGAPVEIRLRIDGEGADGATFKFAARLDGVWTTLREYSDDPTFSWTPSVPGDYILGFYAKSGSSKRDFDSFRYQAIAVS